MGRPAPDPALISDGSLRCKFNGRNTAAFAFDLLGAGGDQEEFESGRDTAGCDRSAAKWDGGSFEQVASGEEKETDVGELRPACVGSA